jgi:hypothetical protein
MIVQYKTSKLLFLFLIFCTFNLVHGIEKNQNKIIWKETNLASGYQVQIKDSNNRILVDKKIDTNSYPIDNLKEGVYTVRTAALSPFGKAVVWSSWHRILIKTKPISEKGIASLEENNPTKEEAVNNSSTSSTKNTKIKCSSKDISPEIIYECKEDYIVLDLSSSKKLFLYNIFLLGESNTSSRRQATTFFQEKCVYKDATVTRMLEEVFQKKRKHLSQEEILEFEKAKKFQIQCNSE